MTAFNRRCDWLVAATMFGALTLGGMVSAVSATELNPGDTLTSYSTSWPPGGAGYTLRDSSDKDIISDGIVGSVTSNVYGKSGGGFLFAYQITLDSLSTKVTSFTIDDSNPAIHRWLGLSIMDAGAYQSGSEHSPYAIARDGSNSDEDEFEMVRVWFKLPDGGSALKKGETSAMVWFDTDAPAYSLANMGLIDGVSGNVSVYAPVPVPSAGLGVLSLAAVGLILACRRRSRA